MPSDLGNINKMPSDLGNINKNIANKFYQIYNKIKKNINENKIILQLNSELNDVNRLDLSNISINDVKGIIRQIQDSISRKKQEKQEKEELLQKLQTSTPRKKARHQNQDYERKTSSNQDISKLNVELYELEFTKYKLEKQLNKLRTIGKFLAKKIKSEEITKLSKENPIRELDDEELYQYMGLNERATPGGSRKTKKTRKASKLSKKLKSSKKKLKHPENKKNPKLEEKSQK